MKEVNRWPHSHLNDSYWRKIMKALAIEEIAQVSGGDGTIAPPSPPYPPYDPGQPRPIALPSNPTPPPPYILVYA